MAEVIAQWFCHGYRLSLACCERNYSVVSSGTEWQRIRLCMRIHFLFTCGLMDMVMPSIGCGWPLPPPVAGAGPAASLAAACTGEPALGVAPREDAGVNSAACGFSGDAGRLTAACNQWRCGFIQVMLPPLGLEQGTGLCIVSLIYCHVADGGQSAEVG